MDTPGAFAKAFKCPCCKNPWNICNEDNNSNKQSGEGFLSSPPSGSLLPCQPCLSDNKGFSGIDPSNFDLSIQPGENFFQWSNGNWMAKNPIPNEYPSWNTFTVLRDLNLERLKTLLEELSQCEGNEEDEDFKQLKTVYQSFMNEKIIEELSLSPLIPGINLCWESFANLSNPTKGISSLHQFFGVNVFFSLSSSPDKSNSNHTIASLYQSGLGLPDRDYYFDLDKKEKQSKYIDYIEALLNLFLAFKKQKLGSDLLFPSFDAKNAAREIFQFEKELANLHLTRTQSRDPNLTYNKLSFTQLIEETKVMERKRDISWEEYLTYGVENSRGKSFNWNEYFEIIGKSPEALNQEINLSSKNYLLNISRLISRAQQKKVLPFYCLFHLLNNYASHLSNEFVNLSFQFYEKELKGTQELLPRWKRGLNAVEMIVGESLGKFYIQRYFSEKSKKQIIEMVENIREILIKRLEEITWMSEDSKKEAFLKIAKFKLKIGFPDKWKDYSTLKVTENAHVANVIASKTFEFKVELNRMNAPTDKDRWFMTPQTVNAYYHPSLNEIVFPAAILQPPFFDADADLAVQYGSLGAVIGHEMTHGFDDQGRKYDSLGNLRDWWTKSDGEEYDRRAAVMIKQAEKFDVHGHKLNGKLTCGENIADLGGVKLALKALVRYLSTLSDPVPPINGLTPLQRFFLAWSQTWRENSKLLKRNFSLTQHYPPLVKKERAIQLVTIDPHGPNELRCNGTLSNIPEFYEAFGVPSSAKMWISEEDRVDIW